jgi:hypothetical protein
MKKARSWTVTFHQCEGCKTQIKKGDDYTCLCADCANKKEGVTIHLHRNKTTMELLCRDEYYAERDAKIRKHINDYMEGLDGYGLERALLLLEERLR